MRYEKLYRLTLNEGGATVRLRDGAVLGIAPDGTKVPATGFVVGAMQGSYHIVPVAHPEAFDMALNALINRASAEGWTHFGTWVNKSDIHIDPVYVFADKTFAMGVAFGLHQEAIYDLATGSTIFVKGRK